MDGAATTHYQHIHKVIHIVTYPSVVINILHSCSTAQDFLYNRFLSVKSLLKPLDESPVKRFAVCLFDEFFYRLCQ
jgi:hypothetical protein